MSSLQVTTGLNEKELAFVIGVTDNGLSIRESAKRAGYSEMYGYKLQNNKAIAAAIHDRIWWLLRTNDAPAARRVLYNIMMDESASKSARIECAKTLLNRGGYAEPKPIAPESGGLDKAPSEMTGDELRQAIDKMQRELGVRATGASVIDAHCEPVEGGQSSQAVDLLG